MNFLTQSRAGAALLALSAISLAACSSGGSDDEETINFIAQTPSNFAGQTGLRLNIIDRDLGTNGNFLYREENGENTINIIDANTFEYVNTEASPAVTLTFTYDAASDSWKFPGAPDAEFQLVDTGQDYIAFFLAEGTADPQFGVQGGFGIFTAGMPTGSDDVTYSGSSFARVFIRDSVSDPTDENLDIRVFDSGVNLTANFASGTLAGTVFEGSTLVDVDDDMSDDDRVAIRVDLDATISGSTFTGTVTGEGGTVDLNDDGVDVQAVGFTLAGTDADGGFYGPGAGLVAGSWEGDYTLSEGMTTISTGEIIGVFDAER